MSADLELDALREVVPPPQMLLAPMEADGPSMADFISEFKSDAKAQEHLVRLVGRVLDKTVQLNDAKGAGNKQYGCPHPLFHSSHKCPLKPSAYVQRLLHYSAASPCNLVIATVYLQKLKNMGGNGAADTKLRLTSFNIQRLLAAHRNVAGKQNV
jgi:hypothetical protein